MHMVSYYLLGYAIVSYLFGVCGFCHTIMYLEHNKQGAKDPYGSFTLSPIVLVL